MSVAFRRDSDEEHLEPRFELPLPPGPNLVTKRGLALIEERVTEFQAALLAESDEEKRKPVLRDLRYWRSRLATAQIAPLPSGETVAIGTRVTIERDGERRQIDIVGHDEADPANHRLAFAAPLAKALLGGEVGEEVHAPGSPAPVMIIAIEPLPSAD
jgi:transcription elongation GreA/GreB family factor